MRVLQLHTRYRESGGEDTVVAVEGRLLRSAGHTVFLHEAANPSGVKAAAALAASAWNPLAAREVTRAVREFRPDVVHVHNTWFAMTSSAPAAASRAGAPVVMTLHNFRRTCVNASLFRDGAPCQTCVGRSPWPGVRHRCYRSSLVASSAAALSIAVSRRVEAADDAVDVFVVLNDFMRDVLVRAGLPGDRTVVQGNVVPDPGPRLRPPSQGRKLLVVGRLDPLKGVDLLVEAWREAAPRDLELVVVGDGPLRPRLEAMDVPGVHITGHLPREQVQQLMLGATALALPSVWYEGQPMSALEAMAAGLPVLSSDIGGLPELVRGQGEGWLVETGSRVAWATALERLDRSAAPDLDAAGRSARAAWRSGHSPEVALRGLESAYARAAR